MTIPDDLESRWLSVLSEIGYRCELHPDIRLTVLTDSTNLWLKINQLPPQITRTRPDLPLLVSSGFEPRERAWYIEEEMIEDVPEQAREFAFEFFWRTSMGRSDLDLALQMLGAAALANVTDGLFETPDGDLIAGTAAVNMVLKDRHFRRLSDVGETPFEAWPPLTFDGESEFTFAPKIDQPPGQSKRPWWKLW